MISIWAFVVACAVFLGILVVEFHRYIRLEGEYEAVAHFLDLYVNKYGPFDSMISDGVADDSKDEK